MKITNNARGLALAVLSSVFIGLSFILKKIGLKRAGSSGTRAGFGGYDYLLEPFWWAGMLSMFFGEIANFMAYVFAPAVLVTPLGALSIIVSSVLAHFLLGEQLQKLGVLGCISCVVGSVVIVLHAPQESSPSSIDEIWILATEPAFLGYTATAVSVVCILVLHFESRYGQSNILVYLGICSLMGSLTVVSIKAIGIAIKLTLEGTNQAVYPQTWFFVLVAVICVFTQLNYLNKALDSFNTALVSPIYYVMFTTLTILASAIMFKDWSGQDISSIASELCGFITVLSGTVLLHCSREPEAVSSAASISWYIWKASDDLLKNIHDDHFVTLHSSDCYQNC
ncbi:putative magnesium transporter NIPA6 [Wolffia australiana]